MISKENIKYIIFIAFVSIILYKLVDSPTEFISGIGGLANFLSPFLIGILFALLLDPMVMYFENKIKTHRLINILISYIIVFVILFVGIKLLIPALLETLNNLITEIPSYIDMANNFLNKTLSSTKMLESISPHIKHSLDNVLNKSIELLTRLSTDILGYVLSITSLLFNIVMGVILSIYMLLDKEKIALAFKKLLFALNSKNKANDIIEFSKISHDIFYSYIIGKIIDSLIIALLAFIGFKFIIRIDHVMFLSFIIFITNIIPYFGPFIGAVPPILMTLTYSPIKALWVAVFILVLQQIDGNIIGPKVMGDQVGLSPLWIISAVLIGGSLFGVVGVFLSVPIAAVIKETIDKYVEKRIHIRDSL